MRPENIKLLQFAHSAIENSSWSDAENALNSLKQSPEMYVHAEHAMAVLEKKRGNFEKARRSFALVIERTPNDPTIHNNYANCLRHLGRVSEAAKHYRAALELRPDYADAIFNLGLLLKNNGDLEDAIILIEKGLASHPGDVRMLQVKALLLRELLRPSDSLNTVEKALAIEPSSETLITLRAELQMDLGISAQKSYRKALESYPDNSQLKIGYANSLFSEGLHSECLEYLQFELANRPDWIEGHVVYANLAWQAGHSGQYMSQFELALDEQASNEHFAIAYINTLMRSGKYEQALPVVQRMRETLDNERLLDRYSAVCASECGDLGHADTMFERTLDSNDVELRLAWLRHLARKQEFSLLETQALDLALKQEQLAAWPYLSIVWRIKGDPRWEWLDGNPQLVQVTDFSNERVNLAGLAEVLRACHYSEQHPFDQSMRRGSQTEGNLILRQDTEIVQLRGILEEAIADYIDNLPPFDAKHPFLNKRRDSFAIDASYSVRLTSSGFHVSHVHPESAISCCFYVAVPESINHEEISGWLALGAAPETLNIDLPAFRHVQPVPGRLVLFPSLMWHGTTPFSSGERLTVVSDITLRN